MPKKNIIPEAKAALNQFKYEIANETGLPVKNNDYSEMTSYQYGYMVKKMIEEQEKQMTEKNHIL
ncbi:alpha/beta-type small acid-soluble spore protein [Clostridium sp. Marseille-P2415]|uniref:alpha/beta-type small acid-soluble spore protein n=1 Tax=Clostridium sp. Marseille-P2415 TaxID=1805471 RepID=UPI0009887ED5|nr:alpha/beta-type small acid-soluble spore protein [Clostridium sp. Marseille-P2415]